MDRDLAGALRVGVGILAAGAVVTAVRWPTLPSERKRWAGAVVPAVLFVAYALA
ncbi:hypothetical protein ITP53_11690 [Nonomuraea sp. K274]|uniref:Uncharacterized protein n=1 Tax=Nonomuraea cypriaca TaxID=1187855 RepID=A0A931EZP9_9ACTN|nr:hypothetical protein [Nonomuraea cypriaca]MBF8186396.1 hypothetical protein [Nonomuraea cypriaca]